MVTLMQSRRVESNLCPVLFFPIQGIRVMCWTGLFPADFRVCLLGPCSRSHFHCSLSYLSYPLSCIVQDILGSCGGKKPNKQYICQIWWVHEHECLLKSYYLEVILIYLGWCKWFGRQKSIVSLKLKSLQESFHSRAMRKTPRSATG